MVGNGFCNDEANTENCNYDNGDCCGSCVVTTNCIECACLDSNNTFQNVLGPEYLQNISLIPLKNFPSEKSNTNKVFIFQFSNDKIDQNGNFTKLPNGFFRYNCKFYPSKIEK